MYYRVQIAVGATLMAACALAAQERRPAAPGATQRMGPPATMPGRSQFPLPGRGDTPTWGQGRRPGEPRPGEPRLGEPRPGKGKPGDSTRRRWSGHTPPFLFELAEKSPEDQEKFLQSNERFNRLPPEVQQNLRHRLKEISAMPPDRRAKLRERFEIFHRLPEEARDTIREQVFPVWNRLPGDRRGLLLEELRSLRRMNSEARQQRLGSDAFTRTYTLEERQVLQQLVDLSPAPPPKRDRYPK